MTLAKAAYQECGQCVMDTSDPEVSFDEQGVCNHCTRFTETGPTKWFPQDGQTRWQIELDQIKHRGRAKPYDCILGLSGGVDSSYLAVMAKSWGLRPLAVHVDAGWNSELAVANIESVIRATGFDLHTEVVEWEEMRDLQVSYMKSGISNQDVPQDHVFFATLYHLATKKGITEILSGGNFATESVFPSAWHHSAMDSVNLRAINKEFGGTTLRRYRTVSPFDYFIRYPLLKGMVVHRPLNYFTYDREEAISFLTTEIGFKPYGRKHGESRFTKFFQEHFLPEKFGFDKRRPHFSSMILSGQLSRAEARELLSLPLYEPRELAADYQFVASKLDISVEELEGYVSGRASHYSDFRNWDRWLKLLGFFRRVAKRYLRISTGLRY